MEFTYQWLERGSIYWLSDGAQKLTFFLFFKKLFPLLKKICAVVSLKCELN